MTHASSANDEVEELILRGECDTIEFKSTLRYDLRANAVNKKLEYVIAKTVSAFMNTDGGHLFIGLDDNQNALGLENDYQTLKKPNQDGFELHLIEVIRKYIGGEYSSHYKVSFPTYT